ncbi:lectin [Dentipellis sp. KUC8613]|nr:lectin [Dentipellis sp. KUC8613]
MAYTMNVRVYQKNTCDWYNLVEKAIFSQGTWGVAFDEHVIRMAGSGTSGSLRFVNAAGNYFIVALGVHNYKPWLDIAINLGPSDTCVKTHPEWYTEGTERAKARWSQWNKVDRKDAKSENLSTYITKEADHQYWVNIVIG